MSSSIAQTRTMIIASVGSWWAALDIKRSANRIGNNTTRKLNFLEKGCKEPINENINPLKADKKENKYTKIRKSVST